MKSDVVFGNLSTIWFFATDFQFELQFIRFGLRSQVIFGPFSCWQKEAHFDRLPTSMSIVVLACHHDPSSVFFNQRTGRYLPKYLLQLFLVAFGLRDRKTGISLAYRRYPMNIED